MLVYGDPQDRERLSAAVGRLRRCLARSKYGGSDPLRQLLVEAGKLEQGIEDHLAERRARADSCAPHDELGRAACRFTDLAAAAFCGSGEFDRAASDKPNTTESDHKTVPALTGALEQLITELKVLCKRDDPLLTIKVPEGFAFYSLFPEQYAASAWKWAQAHGAAPGMRVVVIGIRSIGTTLSAVVAETLKTLGWDARRRTVRPTGSPFARQARIDPSCVSGTAHALVVDEGPGLSGSSMAAVKTALNEAGVPNVAFLPGHPNDPGESGSEAVRKTWVETPRHVTVVEELRWSGKTLRDKLRAATAIALRCEAEELVLEDHSDGRWREAVFGKDQRRWPPTPMERVKYRCGKPGGEALLWKFAGFEARDGFVPGASPNPPNSAGGIRRIEAVDHVAGFDAFSWVHGTRLQPAEDCSPELLRNVGRFLVGCSRGTLSATDSKASAERLKQVLFWNTSKQFGDELGAVAKRIGERHADRIGEGQPAYGDGRMGRWEWIKTPSGQICKADSGGHDRDHTVIGPQSLAWDVAGLLAEWNLAADVAEPVFAGMEERGVSLPAESVLFHQAAYAAFRLGLMRIAADPRATDPESQRRQRAADYYGGLLRRLLEQFRGSELGLEGVKQRLTRPVRG